MARTIREEITIAQKNGYRLELSKSVSERDLGIIVEDDYSWTGQVVAAASKANRILGCIRNSFSRYTSDVARLVYPVFVRPHLEFAVPVWNPRKACDVKCLEKVQRRATRTVELTHRPYAERLEKLDLTNLTLRRKRGDLIQCYKLVKGMELVDWSYSKSIFNFVVSDSRRNRYRLIREKCSNYKQRFDFLLNRVATSWNNLPKNVAEAPTLDSFKARLDKYLKSINGRTSIYTTGPC